MRIRFTIPRPREPVASLCFGFAGLESMMKMLRIDQLRPTQMTHGMREAREKTEKYKALSGHEPEMAIAESPIAGVHGPNGHPYQTEHHHVATSPCLASM